MRANVWKFKFHFNGKQSSSLANCMRALFVCAHFLCGIDISKWIQIFQANIFGDFVEKPFLFIKFLHLVDGRSVIVSFENVQMYNGLVFTSSPELISYNYFNECFFGKCYSRFIGGCEKKVN